MNKKYYEKAYSVYNQGVLIFLTAVKYSMCNGTISLTSQIASLFTNVVPLTAEDRCLIKCLRVEKRLNAFQMMREFPRESGTRSSAIAVIADRTACESTIG